MRRSTYTAPTSTTRLWRQLVWLFAGVLVLGLFTPIAATAAPGALLVKDKTTVEDAGTVSVRIVLAKRVDHKVWVSYRTKNGSATAGADYTAASGRIKFPAGAKARHITVQLLDDSAVEGNETFKLRIFDADRASIVDRVGRVTIVEDDAAPPYVPPTMSVKDATAQEGDTLSFQVSLSKAAEGTVTFTYATSDGTAKAPGDYTAVTAGQGTIAAGATSTTVTVATAENSTPEAEESMTLTLSAPVGATLGDATAKGTITDDDAAVSVSVGDAAAQEGNAVEFVVTLSKASGLQVKVEWETADGTAVQPGDYDKSDGVVTIPAGDLKGTFKVKTVNDDTDEVNETFRVTLSAPHNATIGDGTAVGTIRDNDGPRVFVSDTSSPENARLRFTVELGKSSVQDVSVAWKTSDGTAKAPADYTASSGTVTIPAGSTTAVIAVPVFDDALDERDETVKVTLSDPVNGWISDGEAWGTIEDNDAAPTVWVGNTSADEGDRVRFTVTLSAVSGRDVTVDWKTSDGAAGDTATPAVDYLAGSDTVTVPAGSLTATFAVGTVEDTTAERAETFQVGLSNPVHATLGTTRGTGTILNDDIAP
ncbi:MAG: Calx-beta domain-containing protein [Nocardioides sp.]